MKVLIKKNCLQLKKYKGNVIPKIDMHAHYLPQAYNDALLNRGEKNSDGFPNSQVGSGSAFKNNGGARYI